MYILINIISHTVTSYFLALSKRVILSRTILRCTLSLSRKTWFYLVDGTCSDRMCVPCALSLIHLDAFPDPSSGRVCIYTWLYPDTAGYITDIFKGVASLTNFQSQYVRCTKHRQFPFIERAFTV